jgi:hypothetical protein
MTNEPKLAPEPAKDAANQTDKAAEAKPIVAPAPAATPPVDVKKT